jgi:hypothetical protein
MAASSSSVNGAGAGTGLAAPLGSQHIDEIIAGASPAGPKTILNQVKYLYEPSCRSQVEQIVLMTLIE